MLFEFEVRIIKNITMNYAQTNLEGGDLDCIC